MTRGDAMRIDVRVRHAVGPIDLDVRFASDAAVVALFGPSGAGKTTLLRVIAGLVDPVAARVVVNGRTFLDADRDVRLAPEDREVGYVPQDPSLFPHLDVAANLDFGARRARREARALPRDAVVDLLEIEDLLSRRVAALSGGEKRRVALGRALLSGPSLLLLDEPFTGLDAPLRQRLLPLLARVFTEFKVPALLVTHSRTEVLALAEEVVAIDRGRQIAHGPALRVLNDPLVIPLEQGASIENVLDGRVAEHDDEAGLSAIQLGPVGAGRRIAIPRADVPVGARVLLAFPSEDVIVALARPQAMSVRTVLHGRVTAVREALGGCFVEVDGDVIARVSHGARRELALAPGAEVFLLVKAFSIQRLA